MRRINEFKGYRSAVEYDVESGQFIVTPMPGAFSDAETEDSDTSSAEIVPFPEPIIAPQKQRMAG
jgi:hypothetical protein